MSADSTKKTLVVAVSLCLVCSVLVSSAAVALSSVQEENKKLDKLKNILIAGDLYENKASIQKVYKDKVEGILIELKSGDVVSESKYNDKLNVEGFNIEDMADDPQYGIEIPSDEDIAGIKSKPKFMPVYEVKSKDQVEKFIFPIYGKGLWSTLYGFLSIDKDLRTIRGITFYQHGETPGLGGEVDNPKWKELWKGKKAFDENNDVKIAVIKGKVDNSDPNKDYLIDGLSGATITTRGVDNFVKFWLGEHGYGPFIEKLRHEGGSDE